MEAVFKREELMPVTAKEVVVAEVPVAFTKVKFCRVEEAVARRFRAVTRPLLLTERRVVEVIFTTSNDFVLAELSVPQTVSLA